MDNLRLELFLQSLPVALAGAYVAFYLTGVYRGVWRYTGVGDLLRYVKASLGTVLLVSVSVLLLYPQQRYSPVVFLLFAVFLFLGLAASRSSFRILDLFSGQQARPAEQRVLICGAGDPGEMALRWIIMNPQLEYRPVGFLDEDPFLAGRQIHGVEVLGGLEQLETLLENRQIDGLILTTQAMANQEGWELLVSTSHKHGCWVRALRLEFELLE
jgi:UDP-GlcNAc:undecaprenyl-phosphate GlcNAc-1-phosphate transferase